TLEDGGTVDLSSYLDNTDDQTVTDFSLDASSNILTLSLEDGNTKTLDLSVLNNSGTDDQTLSLSGNVLTLEDGGTVDLSSYLDNTDDQTVTDFSLDASSNILTLSLEDGNTKMLDLSVLNNSGTDDQTLSLSGNVLTLEDGGTVDLSAYLDNSDDQTVTDFSLDASSNILTLSLEDGNTKTVDLSVLNNPGTDDQVLSLSGNVLTLEDGGTVDLSSYLDNTDDQTVTDFSLDASSNILTLSLEDGNTKTVDLSVLNNPGTDDQTLSLSGNVLSLEDGGTVDLSAFLDNTDDQNLTSASLSGTVLQVDIEGGTSASVDLASLNTDEQDLELDATTNILSLTNDGTSVDLNNLSLSGDLKGTLGAAVVSGIQGNAVQNVALTDKDVLQWNGTNSQWEPQPVVGDNLGNHKATQNIQLRGKYLSNDGGNEGVFVKTDGKVGIGTSSPAQKLDVRGNIRVDDAIYSKNGHLTLEAASSKYVEIKPKSTNNYGLMIREHNSNDYGNIYVNNDGLNLSYNANAPRLTISTGGDVGIGTSSPDARLHVKLGYRSFTYTRPLTRLWAGNYGKSSGSGTETYNAAVLINGGVAIYGGDLVVAHYATSSDVRIKNIQERADGGDDLKTLMQIPITRYKYIDSLGHMGNHVYTKVIAQEVQKILPHAVRKSVSFIPNIYKLADSVSFNVNKNTLTLLVPNHKLKEKDKVKVMVANGKTDEQVVGCVVCVSEDYVSLSGEEISDYRWGSNPSVFVYGKEVDDFLNVDYTELGMLNISATQQQQRIIEIVKSENEKIGSLLKQTCDKVEKVTEENLLLKKSLKSLATELDQIKSRLGIQ
ncbi:hypothetical protein DF185_16335, partial [Marinifilum breve]